MILLFQKTWSGIAELLNFSSLFPLADDPRSPSGLPFDNPSHRRTGDIIIILCVEKDLDISNIVLNVGRNEGVFRYGLAKVVEFPWCPLAVVCLAKLPQLKTIRVATNIEESDLDSDE